VGESRVPFGNCEGVQWLRLRNFLCIKIRLCEEKNAGRQAVWGNLEQGFGKD
jgi:hypothetical protein